MHAWHQGMCRVCLLLAFQPYIYCVFSLHFLRRPLDSRAGGCPGRCLKDEKPPPRPHSLQYHRQAPTRYRYYGRPQPHRVVAHTLAEYRRGVCSTPQLPRPRPAPTDIIKMCSSVDRAFLMRVAQASALSLHDQKKGAVSPIDLFAMVLSPHKHSFDEYKCEFGTLLPVDFMSPTLFSALDYV